MDSTMITWAVIIGAVLFVAMMFNRLVTLRNRHKNAFSQIDVQLQRRYDLIPNLVETAKGYAKHERETLEAVITARNEASAILKGLQAGKGQLDVSALNGAEDVLGGMMSKLFALSESYPDLKADAQFQQLMEELSSTENRIGFARQAFNDAVMEYNTYRESFPSNIIANGFSFQAANLLEFKDKAIKKPVKVNFG
ncbi:LemA family protein [Bermanella sp. WJH001]|uniref:LemA family protein n=1 Tax=Bermanella sp. WJH001 TaxID=3048005 RepID=UPI0024BDA990|nr:LemA family protein [Bermanella sp. WJH001]MDJ1539048.1 LemA family protein [Bermanella sp. WJH001]